MKDKNEGYDTAGDISAHMSDLGLHDFTVITMYEIHVEQSVYTHIRVCHNKFLSCTLRFFVIN